MCVLLLVMDAQGIDRVVFFTEYRMNNLSFLKCLHGPVEGDAIEIITKGILYLLFRQWLLCIHQASDYCRSLGCAFQALVT